MTRRNSEYQRCLCASLWETNFGDSPKAREAAEAFVSELTGLAVTDEHGEEIELWASSDPEDPSWVVVGVHETELPTQEVMDLVLDLVLDAEQKVRANHGILENGQRPKAARKGGRQKYGR